ncbi:transcription factor IIF subunit tfg1 [Basidiobolus ranarum]|uniref:Transcription initiation factor IIF subunit alpha n=1 Tax=Basidiobolus ranarum TaxID=34480 RepID=A0ABR2W3Y4_9FUNG
MSNTQGISQRKDFTEHRLVSGSRKSVYNILKFHGSKPVKLGEFNQPIKLVRKKVKEEVHTLTMEDGTGEGTSGPNGGGYNSNTNTTSNSNPNTTPGAPGVSSADPTIIAPYGNASRNKQMLFKKRTKQVFPTDELSRKIKEQEAKPWVLEDTDHTNHWSGVLEGGQQSNYYLFICTDEGFQVVPAHKWYKFNQKLTYATLTIEEAEEQLIRAQKKDSDRWMMRKRLVSKLDGEGGEDEEPKSGKKLKLVDHDDNQFFEEDDDDGKKKRGGGGGASKHGDIDEMDFDEEFQDDEEAPPELDGDQEETKENEQSRQKAKAVVASEDEEEEEEDAEELSAAGKDLKKALRTLEKNAAYDSDDNENPYLSEEEEEEEVEENKENKESSDDKKGKAPENSPTPVPPVKKPLPANLLKKGVPPPKPSKPSGIFTPKNGAASKVVRPAVGKANATARLAEAKKRKEESDESEKKSVAVTHNGGSDSNLITEAEITELIRNNRLSTKDLITKVKKKLKADSRNKQLISTIVKKVATTKDGFLELK